MTEPENNYYSADDISEIKIKAADIDSGINCLASSLSISFIPEGTDKELNCTRCKLDGCQDGSHETTFSHKAITSGINNGDKSYDEGEYVAKFTLSDMAGNTFNQTWSFVIDGNSTHTPSLTVDNGFEYDKVWYVADRQPKMTLTYSKDPTHVELVNLAKRPLETTSHAP